MPVQETSMPVPSQTVPFIDRYRRVTPQWFPWLKRMIDSLRQTVLTVNTIETQVGTIDVTVDQLTTDLNSAELTIATLQDTTVEQGLSITNTLALVSGLTADLGTVKTDVAALDSDIAAIGGDIGAIHARWAVAINGNNQVIGLVRLDGGASGSQFTVVADKFVVAHPSTPGTTVTAFVVGNVNGTPTVGINGNVLIDGSILARHISVSSLDAISASFGNASFKDAAYSTTLIGGQPALTIDFSTPRIRMLSA